MFLLWKRFHSFSSMVQMLPLRTKNVLPHSAAITRQFSATNNVNVLDWPVNSPDLNPIDQVWDELGCRV